MPDEIEIKLKNKKFSELKTSQKALFFTCLIIMIGTLVYTALHLDTLHYRVDTLYNYATGCKVEFRNGVFYEATCPKEQDLRLLNISGELTTKYTLEKYYSTIDNNPFYNFTLGD